MTRTWLRKLSSLFFVVCLISFAAIGCEETETGTGTGPTGGDGDGDTTGGDGDGDSTFTQLYNSPEFQMCQNCHAPGAPGFVDGTEATQDWSSEQAALSSLMGTASGLIGNFADCNGVDFIGETPEDSLLVAAFDETVRQNYDNPAFPDCNADTISDMTLNIGGALSTETRALLDQFIVEQNAAFILDLTGEYDAVDELTDEHWY